MGSKSQKLLRQEMQKVLSNMDERWLSTASKRMYKLLSELLEKQISKNFDFNACVFWDPLAYKESYPGLPDLLPFLGPQKMLLGKNVYIVSKGGSEQSKFKFKSISHGTSTTELELSEDSRIVLIVPALAFDLLGNRLGFGDSLYNVILGRLKPAKVVAIGVAWSLQVISDVADSSEDIVVDWICSEENYIRIAGN
jgi:5-formyltetrahydrofolate cyclo-ligase